MAVREGLVREAHVVHSERAVRRTRAALRELHQALKALASSQRGDLVGAVALAPGEEPDMDQLSDLVQLARAEYMNHEIAVYVVAHVHGSEGEAPRGEAKEDEQHGNRAAPPG